MIEIENLNKTFIKQVRKKGIKGFLFPEKKEFIAVKDISFNVKKGEIIGFVGPNGARKIDNN